MTFVPVKSIEQQAARGIESARDLLVRQHTQLMNAMRGTLAEFGVIAAQGIRGFQALGAKIDAGGPEISSVLLPALRGMLEQWRNAGEQIDALEKQIETRVKADATMSRLLKIPGFGPMTAHAFVTAIGDGSQFRSARDVAAWAGLTPREHQSANTKRKGHISRQGNPGLRRLLVLGASAVMRQARVKPEKASEWTRAILARRPVKVATVARAAKAARIAWRMLRSGKPYRDVCDATA